MNDNAGLGNLIYDLVNGNLNMDSISLPECVMVKSEFEENSECTMAYERVMNAYSNLCRRLNVMEWDDADVEVIINELLYICRHISLKMFHYGVMFGREIDGNG